MTLRKTDPEGGMLRFDSPEVKGERHWSKDYDGRFGLAIYGHDPGKEVKVEPHAYGIDTGCCFGGKLTAMMGLRGSRKDLSSYYGNGCRVK